MQKVFLVIAVAFASLALAPPVRPASASPDDLATLPPNTTVNHLPGPDLLAGASNPQAVNLYHFLGGSAFSPVRTSTVYTYGAGNCMTADGAMTVDYQLPQGATLLGVRIFYYNNGLAGGVNAYLANYNGAGVAATLLNETTTANTGYASEYFALSPAVTIDNYSATHIVGAWIPAGMKLCGARLFYEIP